MAFSLHVLQTATPLPRHSIRALAIMPAIRQRAVWNDVIVLCLAVAASFLFNFAVSAAAPWLVYWLGTTNIAFNFLFIQLLRGMGLFPIGYLLGAGLKRVNPWHCLIVLAVVVVILQLFFTPWSALPKISRHTGEPVGSIAVRQILGPGLTLLWLGLGIAVGRRNRRRSSS